jgi:hypothetical protein
MSTTLTQLISFNTDYLLIRRDVARNTGWNNILEKIDLIKADEFIMQMTSKKEITILDMCNFSDINKKLCIKRVIIVNI